MSWNQPAPSSPIASAITANSSSAAPKVGVNVVNTFIGRDHTKSVDANWPVFQQLWPPVVKHAAAWRLQIKCGQKFQVLVQFWFAGKNIERAQKRHRLTQFGEQFQRMSDVGLRLALEKTLVTALAETGSRVHDKFCVSREWDAAVAGEIEAMERFPFFALVVGADLQMNQMLVAAIMMRHS